MAIGGGGATMGCSTKLDIRNAADFSFSSWAEAGRAFVGRIMDDKGWQSILVRGFPSPAPRRLGGSWDHGRQTPVADPET
jgi:hypothetical protein